MFVASFLYIFSHTKHQMTTFMGSCKSNILNQLISDELTKSVGIKTNTCQELLSNWSMCSTVLHINDWMAKEMLLDMIPK